MAISLWFKILPKNKSVRKAILNVVSIYLVTTILLVLTLAFIYFNSQKDQLFHIQKQQLDFQANEFINKLEELHYTMLDKMITYPKLQNLKTAIYDIDKNLIFSTFTTKITQFDKQNFYKNDYVYFIYEIEPYYLGTAFLVLEKPREHKLQDTFIKLLFILIIIIIVLIVTSFFLACTLIRPLSDNINLLDKFLKDTTHELNTPIAAILGNIEMLNLSTIDEKNQKKIHRIKIGATTISNIYDDLSFLILNAKFASINKVLNISEILNARIEYFKILSDAKFIEFIVDISDEIYLEIDQVKITRLFDNLISNSIKYSKKNRSIIIKLDKDSFYIEDQGQGMSSDEVKNIFQRYTRFDKTVGGFGIGYDIIYTIIKEYDIHINIKSKINEGTKVTLSW